MTEDKATCTDAKSVDEKGGWAGIESSGLRFKENTVKEKAQLKFELHADCTDTCPEGYYAITPKLTCNTVGKVELQKNISIRLQSWCIAEQGKDVPVYVVECDDKGSATIKDKTSLQKCPNGIVFETMSLTSYWAMIKSLHYNDVTMVMIPYIFLNPDGKSTTAIVCGDIRAEETKRRLRRNKTSYIDLPKHTIKMKCGDTIGITFRIRSLDNTAIQYRCEPETAQFQIDESYVRKPIKDLIQQVHPRPIAGDKMFFQYVISHNGNNIALHFQLKWQG